MAHEKEQQQQWREKALKWIIAVLGLLGLYYVYTTKPSLYSSTTGTNNTIGGGIVSSVTGGNDARRLQIEQQRRWAVQKQQQKQDESSSARAAPPTWREQEEEQIWTEKKEKQFAVALRAFKGVPPQVRYNLIAEKVDGKTKYECLMHHKLLALAMEEEEEKTNKEK